MDEKLAKVHDLIRLAGREMGQITTDDPALFAAIDSLMRATSWLLDAVEQINDQRVGR